MRSWVPWVVGGGVVLIAGLALSSSAKAAPTPQPLPPLPQPPSPNPPRPPSPLPTPDPAQALLIAQLQLLAQQAAVNANAVDPQQVETLAYQLDAAGLPQQAAQARALATQIRISRGQRPVIPTPPPPTPDVLLAQYTALLQQASTDPTHTDPVLLDQMAIQLDAAGMTYQASTLRTAAAYVRSQRAQVPPTAR